MLPALPIRAGTGDLWRDVWYRQFAKHCKYTGCWILDTRYWILDTGFWILLLNRIIIQHLISSIQHPSSRKKRHKPKPAPPIRPIARKNRLFRYRNRCLHGRVNLAVVIKCTRNIESMGVRFSCGDVTTVESCIICRNGVGGIIIVDKSNGSAFCHREGSRPKCHSGHGNRVSDRRRIVTIIIATVVVSTTTTTLAARCEIHQRGQE